MTYLVLNLKLTMLYAAASNLLCVTLKKWRRNILNLVVMCYYFKALPWFGSLHLIAYCFGLDVQTSNMVSEPSFYIFLDFISQAHMHLLG